tara:strand:- start:19 stop:864 length:846 start_codon:yes stop_codon:yes gene_type:complete
MFGLEINSDIRFFKKDLRSLKFDVEIKEDKNLNYQKPNNKTYHQLNLFSSRIENSEFICQIDQGKKISYKFFKDIENHVKAIKILHQAIPSILFQRGNFIYHGSALERNNKAILLLGESGSGKSHTADLLSRKYPLISDDTIAIEKNYDSNFCLKGFPYLCVQDNKKKFRLNDKRNRRIKFLSKNISKKEKVKIDKIFFLEWAEENKIKELKLIDAFKFSILNSFRPLPSGDCKNSEIKYFSDISSILNDSKQYIFYRKKGDIKESIRFFEKELENLDARS